MTYDDGSDFDEEYIEETTATFTCGEGYSLSGSITSVCQASRNWSQQPPTCGNQHLFLNMRCTQKILNYQSPSPLKVWISDFLSVDGNGILVLAIMKKLKNGCHFVNICIAQKNSKLPLPPPQKFGSPVFWFPTETEYWCRPL